MLDYYKQTIKHEKLEKISDFEKGCWINVINPTKEEILIITEKYKLDLELLEEGLDEYELPRLDDEDNINYIYLKTINTNEELSTILVILAEDFILTLCKDKNKLIEKILNSKNFITTQKKKAILNILDLNNEHLENSVIKIIKNVNSKKIKNKELNEKDIESLLEAEEKLNALTSSYSYILHLYNKMVKKINFHPKDQDLLDDLIVELEEGLNLCVNSLKTISNIRNYQNLLLSNKLNKTIKILTIFTIFISIPTAISGFYGMNILLPFQNYPYMFFIVLLITIILIIIFLIFLKRKKIL